MYLSMVVLCYYSLLSLLMLVMFIVSILYQNYDKGQVAQELRVYKVEATSADEALWKAIKNKKPNYTVWLWEVLPL